MATYFVPLLPRGGCEITFLSIRVFRKDIVNMNNSNIMCIILCRSPMYCSSHRPAAFGLYRKELIGLNGLVSINISPQPLFPFSSLNNELHVVPTELIETEWSFISPYNHIQPQIAISQCCTFRKVRP